jgi:hypothetical protein
MKLSLRKIGQPFMNAPTSYGDVDGYTDGGSFSVGLHRTVKRKAIPYLESTDFQVLIVQLAGDEDHFLVLPKSVLRKYWYLTTEFCPGKTALQVCNRHNKEHYLAGYWDRFDLLQLPDYQPPDDLLDKVAGISLICQSSMFWS